MVKKLQKGFIGRACIDLLYDFTDLLPDLNRLKAALLQDLILVRHRMSGPPCLLNGRSQCFIVAMNKLSP